MTSDAAKTVAHRLVGQRPATPAMSMYEGTTANSDSIKPISRKSLVRCAPHIGHANRSRTMAANEIALQRGQVGFLTATPSGPHTDHLRPYRVVANESQPRYEITKGIVVRYHFSEKYKTSYLIPTRSPQTALPSATARHSANSPARPD